MAHRGRRNADELLATALAAGATVADAAGQAGVSPRTVQRRLADPAFRDKLAELRSAMVGNALGRLADGMTEAADTLRGLLKADAESVRLGAARSLIELTVKLREYVDLAQRVDELERSMTQGRLHVA